MESEIELPFCECGDCGLRVTKPGNRFISGHNRKKGDSKPAKLSREIRICALPSCSVTFEVPVTNKRKYCCNKCKYEGLKGKNPYPRTEESRKNQSEALSGKPKSKEHRAALSKARIGRSYEDLFGDRAEEEKRKRGNFSRDKTYEELYGDRAREEREKRSVGNRGKHSNLVKSRKGRKSTKPEIQLNRLLQKLFPGQWKYVGDASFWVTSNGKHLNPDFINIAGQKKIIEMNGDYWHGEKRTGRTKEEEEQQRVDLFTELGYQTLIVWQHELEDTDTLKSKVIEFSNYRNLYLVLKRICKNEVEGTITSVKELSCALTAALTQYEHGNIEYKILVPNILEKLNEIIYNTLQ